MKTAMLDDTEPAVFDMNLMNIPGLAEASSSAVWNERMVIGVRNDHGDVYRVIGVSSLSDLHYLLGKLRNLGYADLTGGTLGRSRGCDDAINASELISMPREGRSPFEDWLLRVSGR